MVEFAWGFGWMGMEILCLFGIGEGGYGAVEVDVLCYRWKALGVVVEVGDSLIWSWWERYMETCG